MSPAKAENQTQENAKKTADKHPNQWGKVTVAGKGIIIVVAQLKEALKKISAGLRPVRVHPGPLEVAVAGQEFESRLDEGLGTLAG
jgi:hypothetical protein